MKLFNTLSKQVEDFEPSGDKITIYSCGPTLYRNGHIGNLAAAIYTDTLRRVLQGAFPDKQVVHVMNLTDIDDKTVKESAARFPDDEPMERLKKLTTEIEAEILADYRAVGIDTESIKFVRATEHIDEMQQLIKQLVEAGVAYISVDGIYFSIEAYRKKGRTYGQLSVVDDASTAQARIDNDEYDKDSVHDFALWKVAKPGEPAWDFETGGTNMRGRPGWHIECSAMSVKYLGQPLDIHTGGVDLKFPHHENEIAQSTALAHDKLARFFVHSEHLLVDGAKMAKRDGNFITLKDLTGKGYDPLAFRLLVLQGHYQSQLNFTWDGLTAAQNRLNKLRNLVEAGLQTEQESVGANSLSAPLLDNIATPQLLAGLELAPNQASVLRGPLNELLGLGFDSIEDAPEDVKKLQVERDAARKAGDFEKADTLRDELKKVGFSVMDTGETSVWQRIY